MLILTDGPIAEEKSFDDFDLREEQALTVEYLSKYMPAAYTFTLTGPIFFIRVPTPASFKPPSTSANENPDSYINA